MEPREIVTLCCISSPSLAGVLTRMEETGYVVRERLSHDQRRVKVSLTAKSRALATRIAPKIEAAYADLEAKIGPEFSGQFYEALDRMIATLQIEGGDSEA
ncbi:MAG TPA: homoprotocatechuate degradation operon regulator HpaR, partial [Casimicrobium sp.]|nr:homoprotocatechuate degradation operon regulator HpaR [Casimicrobium sp.]